MDACIEYLQSIPITTYPVDGYGGSYYDVWFPIPTYSRDSEELVHRTSWHQIDHFYRDAASNTIGSAVSFGICLVTLLNIVVLTPQPKRRLPLHSFICLALAFQILRNLMQMILLTRSLPASAYVYLSDDQQSTTLSRTYYVLLFFSQAASWLSFAFVQACFFVQGQALMTWLRLHHRSIYFFVLAYLVLAGLTAAAYRLALAVYQILHPRNAADSTATVILLYGSNILYAISIGSWSLVFLVSAVSIIINRRRTLCDRKSIYDSALNLVAIICLESFIVPLIFCIMQYPAAFGLVRFVNPEQLIIPSILFLLPIGSLFMTAHGKAGTTEPDLPDVHHTLQNSHHQRNAGMSSRPRNIHRLVDQLGSDNLRTPVTTIVSAWSPSDASAQRPSRRTDLAEIELASIDAIDEQEDKINTNRHVK